MDVFKYLKLAEKYNVCPECGNDKIGGGEGSLMVGDLTFRRTCKCGFKVELRVDEK